MINNDIPTFFPLEVYFLMPYAVQAPIVKGCKCIPILSLYAYAVHLCIIVLSLKCHYCLPKKIPKEVELGA